MDPLHEAEGPGTELAQLRLEVHDVVERLTPEERELLDLLFYHGCTQDEAADVLGVNVRTVQRQWLRIKTRLLELLGPCDE